MKFINHLKIIKLNKFSIIYPDDNKEFEKSLELLNSSIIKGFKLNSLKSTILIPTWNFLF